MEKDITSNKQNALVTNALGKKYIYILLEALKKQLKIITLIDYAFKVKSFFKRTIFKN